MSSAAAFSFKGDKDKLKGNYATSKVPNLYQGSPSSTTGKHSTSKHGLQSLGRVRRVPLPVSIPSLKSEGSGSEPTGGAVVSSGAGWVGAEKKDASIVVSSQSTNSHSVAASAGASTVNSSNGKLWSSLLGQKKGELGNDEYSSLDNDTAQEGDLGDEYVSETSLRPQNVTNWRGNSGRAATQERLEEDAGGSGAIDTKEDSVEAGPSETVMSQMRSAAVPIHPSNASFTRSPNSMLAGPSLLSRPGPSSMSPLYAMQPPYGLVLAGSLGISPAYNPRHTEHPSYHDARAGSSIRMMSGDKNVVHNPILKDKDLKVLDSADTRKGEWWASASGEVDYNEKLVFSDEDENSEVEDKRRQSYEKKHVKHDDIPADKQTRPGDVDANFHVAVNGSRESLQVLSSHSRLTSDTPTDNGNNQISTNKSLKDVSFDDHADLTREDERKRLNEGTIDVGATNRNARHQNRQAQQPLVDSVPESSRYTNSVSGFGRNFHDKRPRRDNRYRRDDGQEGITSHAYDNGRGSRGRGRGQQRHRGELSDRSYGRGSSYEDEYSNQSSFSRLPRTEQTTVGRWDEVVERHRKGVLSRQQDDGMPLAGEPGDHTHKIVNQAANTSQPAILHYETQESLMKGSMAHEKNALQSAAVELETVDREVGRTKHFSTHTVPSTAVNADNEIVDAAVNVWSARSGAIKEEKSESSLPASKDKIKEVATVHSDIAAAVESAAQKEITSKRDSVPLVKAAHSQQEGSYKKPKDDPQKHSNHPSNSMAGRGRRQHENKNKEGLMRENSCEGLSFVRSRNLPLSQRSLSHNGTYDDYNYDDDEYTGNGWTASRGSRSQRGQRDRGRNSSGSSVTGNEQQKDARTRKRLRRGAGRPGDQPNYPSAAAKEIESRNKVDSLALGNLDISVKQDTDSNDASVVASLWNSTEISSRISEVAASVVIDAPILEAGPCNIPLCFESDAEILNKNKLHEQEPQHKPQGGSFNRGRRGSGRDSRDMPRVEYEHASSRERVAGTTWKEGSHQQFDGWQGPSHRSRGSRRGGHGNAASEPAERRQHDERGNWSQARKPLVERTLSDEGSTQAGDNEVFSAALSTPILHPRLAVTKQSSSDFGNEEWETASESSDVLDIKPISKNELDAGAVSSVLVTAMAMNSPGRGPKGDVGRTIGVKHLRKNSGSREEQGSTRRDMGRGRITQTSVGEGQRPDGQQSSSIRGRPSLPGGRGKTAEEPLSVATTKKEKPKKTLEYVDFTNFASVVVVDHQFGLQDVDPNLANNDDGFQEVVSRKAKNKQQKARAEISQKKLTELSLSTSQSAAEKVVTGVPGSEAMKSKHHKSCKNLPPRLQGARGGRGVNASVAEAFLAGNCENLDDQQPWEDGVVPGVAEAKEKVVVCVEGAVGIAGFLPANNSSVELQQPSLQSGTVITASVGLLPDAIQLPTSFKTPSMDNEVSFGIDFTFDASLAPMSDSSMSYSESVVQPLTKPELDVTVTSVTTGLWSLDAPVVREAYSQSQASSETCTSFTSTSSLFNADNIAATFAQSTEMPLVNSAHTTSQPLTGQSQATNGQVQFGQLPSPRCDIVVSNSTKAIEDGSESPIMLHFSQNSKTSFQDTPSGLLHSAESALPSHYSAVVTSASHNGGSGVVTVSYKSDSPLLTDAKSVDTDSINDLTTLTDTLAGTSIEYTHSAVILGEDGGVSGGELTSLPETLMDDLADRLTAVEATSSTLNVTEENVSSMSQPSGFILQHTQLNSQPSPSLKQPSTKITKPHDQQQQHTVNKYTQQQQTSFVTGSSLYYDTKRDYSAGSNGSTPGQHLQYTGQQLFLSPYQPFQVTPAPVALEPKQAYMAQHYAAYSLVSPPSQGTTGALASSRTYSHLLPTDMYQQAVVGSGSQSIYRSSGTSQPIIDFTANNSSLVVATLKADLPAAYVAGGQKTTGLGGTTFQPGGHGAVYIPTLPLGYDVGQSLNQRQPQSVSLQNASRVIAPTQYLQHGSGVAGFQPMVNQSSFLAATPQIMQQTGFYQTQLGSSSLQQSATPAGHHQVPTVFGQGVNVLPQQQVGASGRGVGYNMTQQTSNAQSTIAPSSQLNRMSAPFTPASAMSQSRQVKPAPLGSASTYSSPGQPVVNMPSQQPGTNAMQQPVQHVANKLLVHQQAISNMVPNHATVGLASVSQPVRQPVTLYQPQSMAIGQSTNNKPHQPVYIPQARFGTSSQSSRYQTMPVNNAIMFSGNNNIRGNQPQKHVAGPPYHLPASGSRHTAPPPSIPKLPSNSSHSNNASLAATQPSSRNTEEMQKQRREALQTAAAFLNPQKKPPSRNSESLVTTVTGSELGHEPSS